jgi:hypothetical protein
VTAVSGRSRSDPPQTPTPAPTAAAGRTDAATPCCRCCRFEVVPRWACDAEGLTAAHSSQRLPYTRDGLLLLHVQSHYTRGSTPLALLWKDPSCTTYFLDTDPKGVVPQYQVHTHAAAAAAAAAASPSTQCTRSACELAAMLPTHFMVGAGCVEGCTQWRPFSHGQQATRASCRDGCAGPCWGWPAALLWRKNSVKVPPVPRRTGPRSTLMPTARLRSCAAAAVLLRSAWLPRGHAVLLCAP